MRSRNVWIPFLLLFVGSLSLKFLSNFGMLTTLLLTTIYFFFGYYLQPKRMSKTIWTKVISIVVVGLLVLFELGYLQWQAFSEFATFLSLQSSIGILLKVYAGYLYKL